MPATFRAYFVLVGLFALWVGAWGFAAPAEVGRALPWTVPPLHARFIAAMYLAGALAMGASLLASRIATVRIPTALAALWTGALLLASLLHFGAFDFTKPQVWFWFGAYLAFPAWGAWLYFREGAAEAQSPRRRDPVLVFLAVLFLAFACGLLAAPGVMARAWPWPISPLLANLYAGPFFAYGVATLLLAREARPASRLIVLASMLAFVLLALAASLLHLKLFHFDTGPSAWIWFGLYTLAALLLALRLIQARRGTA